jgi:hypothetical protein
MNRPSSFTKEPGERRPAAFPRRSNLALYLVLNVLVSAATTLGVLFIWDTLRKAELSAPPVQPAAAALPAGPTAAVPTVAGVETEAAATPPASTTPEPSPTPLPPGAEVIQIQSVVGAGDLALEVVMLRRVGEGNLPMTGWKLEGERGQSYVFPGTPALTLYKDGAVQVYSRTGDDTVMEVFWDRGEPAWQSGEVIRLVDPEGTERATYKVP